MTKTKDQLINMGHASHPHGIKGEVELRLLNENFAETSLKEGLDVILFPKSEKSILNKNGEAWVIEKLRMGNKLLCLFKGIKDRTHLETLLPFEVFLDREHFSELDDDEVYLVDLVGVKVLSLSGEELGVLESFSDNGMQYLFEVRLIDGTLITLPYVESFFPEIDMEKQIITMVMPEYTE